MTEYTEAGLFAVVGERTVRGLLLPYGETSRLSANGVQPIAFPKGAVTLPRDPSVVTLNVEHDRFNPVGRAIALEDTDAGVVATFAIADTDEGDAYLAAPERRKLSAELADIVRRGAEGIKSRLTGAALVTEGAFASAGLFALGAVEDQDEAVAIPADARAQITEDAPAPEDTAAETDSNTEAATAAEPEETEMPDALAPATVADAAVVEKAKEMGANAVFAAMTAVRNNSPEAEQMLAALADIKSAGTGALPVAGVIQADWIGQVWQGRAYQRKFITLGTQGVIRSPEAKGFRLDQGTALVQPYAGQKAAMPTGTATTEVVSSTLQKFGFAADIAAEFWDLPGGEEVIAAFWAGVVESYARVSDEHALTVMAGSSEISLGAETYPDGYSQALGMVIQGIEAVEDQDDSATFAILSRDLYREILYTPKDALPHFVSFDVNTEFTGTANGNVTLVRAPASFGTDRILVGSKAAIRFNELSTTPVTFDALNVAKNGVDRGTVGYVQTLIERPLSLVTVGRTPAGA